MSGCGKLVSDVSYISYMKVLRIVKFSIVN